MILIACSCLIPSGQAFSALILRQGAVLVAEGELGCLSLRLGHVVRSAATPVANFLKRAFVSPPSAPRSAAIILLGGFGVQGGEVFLAIYIGRDISSSWSWTSERRLIP